MAREGASLAPPGCHLRRTRGQLIAASPKAEVAGGHSVNADEQREGSNASSVIGISGAAERALTYCPAGAVRSHFSLLSHAMFHSAPLAVCSPN
jgi:hypothetical protein